MMKVYRNMISYIDNVIQVLSTSQLQRNIMQYNEFDQLLKMQRKHKDFLSSMNSY